MVFKKLLKFIGIIVIAVAIPTVAMKLVYPINSAELWYKGSELTGSADSKEVLRLLEKQIDKRGFLGRETKEAFSLKQIKESKDSDIYVEIEPSFMFTKHLSKVNSIQLLESNGKYFVVINQFSAYSADSDTVESIRELLAVS